MQAGKKNHRQAASACVRRHDSKKTYSLGRLSSKATMDRICLLQGHSIYKKTLLGVLKLESDDNIGFQTLKHVVNSFTSSVYIDIVIDV